MLQLKLGLRINVVKKSKIKNDIRVFLQLSCNVGNQGSLKIKNEIVNTEKFHFG